MVERIDGKDPLDARFCRYSAVVSPLIMESVEVRPVCLEDCPHAATIGIDQEGKVKVRDQTFDAPQ
jgi:hypothetical protein